MSFNLNTISIAGHLTRDPELKDIGGQQVCKFSVAVNESFKGKDGTKKERPTYFDVDAWGGQAAPCAQYLKTGSGVYVEGKMDCRDYEKDGQKRKAWTVRAGTVQFLGSPVARNQVVESDPPPRAAKVKAAAAAPDPDDSCPF